MPYIKNEDSARNKLKPNSYLAPMEPGELNYQITMLVQQYLDEVGLSYTSINDVVGALEGAKLEFYRRVAVPYEDKKIKENGDVYSDR